MKKLKNLVYGWYYVFNRTPFTPQREGYVQKKDLIDLETAYAEGLIALYERDRGVSDWEYTEDDEIISIDYTLFVVDDTTYLVDNADLWCKVCKDDSFDTGWGCNDFYDDNDDDIYQCGKPRSCGKYKDKELMFR